MASEIRTVVESCPLFAGLGGDALAAVAARGVHRNFERHAVLFAEEDDADAFYVVLSGRLKLTQTSAEGQQVLVRYVGPGEICAVVAFVPGDTYPVTAEAVEATRVVLWPRAQLQELLLDHPRLAVNAMRLLSDHMREVTTRLRELATERVARRVARALLRLAGKAGRRVEGGVLLDLPLSREDLAAMTGTTLFTVSRLLAGWEREGILEAGRERVVICRAHDLVAVADDL